MTGLEKMKSRILEEARSSAEVKIQDAQRQAQELLDEKKGQAERAAAAILAKARADAEGLKEKAVSASDLERRTKLLSARQEIIGEVLAEAYRKIKGHGRGSVFWAGREAAGPLRASSGGRDPFSHLLTRSACRPDFEAKIQEAARAKGGALTLAEGDAPRTGRIRAGVRRGRGELYL